MKKTFTKLFVGLLFCIPVSTFAQTAANVYPSNLSSNTYFEDYDNNSKVISGIYFSVLADGSNSSLSTPDFTVKLYLYKAGFDPYFIKTFELPDGVKHFSATEYSDISVDLSTISGIPSGTYRMGIYVNADESFDDGKDSDDATLMDGNIVYTAGAVVPAKKADLQVESISYDFISGLVTNIQVKVKNTGDADASASKIKFILEGGGGSLEETNNLDLVPAGGFVIYDGNDFDINPYYDPNTTYSITVAVDADNTVAESNENNNSKVINDISITTGIANISTANDGIFIPTPVASSYLTSLIDNPNVKSISLYSMIGAEVGLDNAQPGVYILKTTTIKGVKMQRILIK